MRKHSIILVIGGVSHTAWRCSTCREWKPEDAFYASKTTWHGFRAQCKECHNRSSILTRTPGAARTRNRKWMRADRLRNLAKYRARERAASRKYALDHKRVARQRLNSRVRSGRILRPARCGQCGRYAKTEGHHKDYSRPYDVEWLCSVCHGERHQSAKAEPCKQTPCKQTC